MALIENGQRLLDVRNKLNAALQPFSSRAVFESSSVPVDLLSVQVIDEEQLCLLYRTGAGVWISGDGALRSAVSLTSLAAPDAAKVSFALDLRRAQCRWHLQRAARWLHADDRRPCLCPAS